MYFIDRMTLGITLSNKLLHLRGKDVILVSLKESSLLTCVSMAIKLRGWIYPLVYEPVMNPNNPTSPLGALTQDGDFCLNPSISESEYTYLMGEFNNQIEERKREAMHKINQQLSAYGTTLDPHAMNGRTVILAADIMTDPLLLAVAKELLKPLSPSDILGVAGNVTADVSDMFHLSTDQVNILDVLPGIVFDDNHYFERPDSYTDEQKKALALNIATFWE